MSDSITITNVLENTCLRHSLLAQHGQSLHINYFGNEYLFDVGEMYQGFIHNFDQMGFDLNNIKGVVLSHRHLDHSGALTEVIKQLHNQTVYITDDLGTPEEREYSEKYRYFKANESGKYNISLSPSDSDFVKKYPHTQVVGGSIEIESGLFLTGALGNELKEQSIIIKTKHGIVVVVGCSHPKLNVIIDKAKEITNENRVYGIIGGFHFKDSTPEQFSQYIDYLEANKPAFLIPGHCTGTEAIQELQKRFGDAVHVAGTGSFGTGNSVQILPELKFNFV